jgi:hypothetical protein
MIFLINNSTLLSLEGFTEKKTSLNLLIKLYTEFY